MKKGISIKRTMSGLVAAAVIAGSIFTTANVVGAANTNLTTWAVTARTGESKFGCTGRKKDNSKPVYVKYTSGLYSVAVSVYGSDSYDGTYIDLSYPDRELSWTIMEKGDEAKISSYVYEVFGSQAYAKLYICVSGTGTFMGSWAPDTN